MGRPVRCARGGLLVHTARVALGIVHLCARPPPPAQVCERAVHLRPLLRWTGVQHPQELRAQLLWVCLRICRFPLLTLPTNPLAYRTRRCPLGGPVRWMFALLIDVVPPCSCNNGTCVCDNCFTGPTCATPKNCGPNSYGCSNGKCHCKPCWTGDTCSVPCECCVACLAALGGGGVGVSLLD
jgi:hypothetical protein